MQDNVSMYNYIIYIKRSSGDNVTRLHVDNTKKITCGVYSTSRTSPFPVQVHVLIRGDISETNEQISPLYTKVKK